MRGDGYIYVRASRCLIDSAGVYHIKWWWGSTLLVIARYVQSLVGRQGRGWMDGARIWVFGLQ